jgi:hypothetical protein
MIHSKVLFASLFASTAVLVATVSVANAEGFEAAAVTRIATCKVLKPATVGSFSAGQIVELYADVEGMACATANPSDPIGVALHSLKAVDSFSQNGEEDEVVFGMMSPAAIRLPDPSVGGQLYMQFGRRGNRMTLEGTLGKDASTSVFNATLTFHSTDVAVDEVDTLECTRLPSLGMEYIVDCSK